MIGVSILRLFSRTPRRDIAEGIQDDKTYRLYREACRLLAERDHEQISMAEFAAAAEMSTGAIYLRHANKDGLLNAVVAIRLSRESQRLARALGRHAWQRQPISVVTRAIVDEMMRTLHGPTAGVVRTALKRGHLDRDRLIPLQGFRDAVADQAVTLLAPRLTHIKKPDKAVRAAMQMVEATMLDALLHEKGPLEPGSRQMAAALSSMLCRMLDPAGTTSAAADGDEKGMLDMPIEDVVPIPVPDGPLPWSNKRSTHRSEAIPIVDPTSAIPAQEDTDPEPVRSKRYRPRL